MRSFFLLLCLLLSPSLVAEDIKVSSPFGKLYTSIFGEKDVSEKAVVPFYFNEDKRPSGTVLVYFSYGDDDVSRFAVAPVVEAADLRAHRSAIESLSSVADNDGIVSVEDADDTGFVVVFDNANALLRITIDTMLREVVAHDVQPYNNPSIIIPTIEPADLSAYINVNAGTGYAFDSSDSVTSRSRQPFTVAFDGTINLRDWIFDGEGDYYESGDVHWARGPMLLSRDIPDKLLRFSFGDITFPTKGFQKTITIGGIAVTKNFELQPSFIGYPIFNEEVFLEHPSIVEIFINDQLYETYYLSAGTHNFYDLPAKTGSNDVIFKITDNIGREKIIPVPFLYTRNALSPKISQHSTAIGTEPVITDGRYRYPGSLWLVSHFYRHGISDTFTLGEYIQARKGQGLFGFEGIVAMKYGALTFDTAASHIFGKTSGGAVSLSFKNFLSNASDSVPQTSWNASTTFYSRRFARITVDDPDKTTRFSCSASAGRPLFYGISGKAGVDYKFLRGAAKDTYSISLNASRKLRSNISTSLQFNFMLNDSEQYDRRCLFTLIWSFPNKNQYITFHRNFNSDVSRTSWRYNSPKSVNAINSTLNYNHSTADDKDEGTISGSVHYTMRRAVLRGSYRNTVSLSDTSLMTGISQMSIGTALVFADGVFSVGKPISGSFAVISRDKSLWGHSVGVDPTYDNDYNAIAGIFPGVISSIPDYQMRTVSIDMSSLPVGTDIGASSYILSPRHSSGFLIPIHRYASALIKGTLVDGVGEVISFQSGYFVDVDAGDEGSPIQFFTDKSGRFVVMGVKPGTYEIQFISEDLAPTMITVPEGVTGKYYIGALTINAVEE
ncbi:MAG: fimbria/pilus outer membrane usher protein [Waddliaceae bacterium]|nr:fimbria/pilus outer membrane usher protein [Waddliaceae bacterium]